MGVSVRYVAKYESCHGWIFKEFVVVFWLFNTFRKGSNVRGSIPEMTQFLKRLFNAVEFLLDSEYGTQLILMNGL